MMNTGKATHLSAKCDQTTFCERRRSRAAYQSAHHRFTSLTAFIIAGNDSMSRHITQSVVAVIRLVIGRVIFASKSVVVSRRADDTESSRAEAGRQRPISGRDSAAL